MALQLTIHGSRGSTPVPGTETMRYGGNTPCLVVATGGGGRLILDAGTGIRSVPLWQEAAGETTIVLTHTHWDHIQGLPFALAGRPGGHRVRLVGPRPETGSLRSVLESAMSPPLFPVTFPSDAEGVTVEELDPVPGRAQWGTFEVAWYPTRHPCPTLGFTLSNGSRDPTVTYLTDNELGEERVSEWRTGLVHFLEGCDVLVHDAMFDDEEIPARRGWGHSSPCQAVGLAAEAGCRNLVLFHHAPEHDDATLERLLEKAREEVVRLGANLQVTLASELTTLTLGGGN